MASLKTPCRTSYRSSIETIALNCLVFEEIAFLVRIFLRNTERRTNRSMSGSFTVIENGTIRVPICLSL